MNIKILSLGDEVTDFYHKEVPKVDCNHTCLAELISASVVYKSVNTLRKKCFFVFSMYFASFGESDEE